MTFASRRLGTFAFGALVGSAAILTRLRRARVAESEVPVAIEQSPRTAPQQPSRHSRDPQLRGQQHTNRIADADQGTTVVTEAPAPPLGEPGPQGPDLTHEIAGEHQGRTAAPQALSSDPKLAWPFVLAICMASIFIAIVLLPSEMKRPQLVPPDLGAVANHSRVYLLGLDGDDSSRATIRWTSDSDDAIAFAASMWGHASDSVLIFAGPITSTIHDCTVNGRPAKLQEGPPGFEFDALLEQETLDAYAPDRVLRLPLRTALGADSPYAACEVGAGLSSAEPPSHWIYTPELTIAVEGLEEDNFSAASNICVYRSVADNSSDQECADPNGRASVSDQLVELQRPREQWFRDLKLTLLGLLVGLVAQGAWDLLSRVRRLQRTSR